jgi:hypothetical protein
VHTNVWLLPTGFVSVSGSQLSVRPGTGEPDGDVRDGEPVAEAVGDPLADWVAVAVAVAVGLADALDWLGLGDCRVHVIVVVSNGSPVCLSSSSSCSAHAVTVVFPSRDGERTANVKRPDVSVPSTDSMCFGSGPETLVCRPWAGDACSPGELAHVSVFSV